MINHITIYVSDFDKSRNFYKQTLAPLGYKIVEESVERGSKWIGFTARDEEGYRDFWIKEAKNRKIASNISCLAFTASSIEVVDEFYKAGITAGGKDNGKPGLRPRYHEKYYAAFVLDPDGNNVEAVIDYL